MPLYRTNIELHEAATDDYLLLDRELRSQQFSPENKQQIADAGKNKRKYLRIRYVRAGNIVLQKVVDDVKHAASKTGKKF